MLNLFTRATVALNRVASRRPLRGVTMLEYVLLGLLVVAVGVLLWNLFGEQLRDAFERLGNAISG